MWGYLEQFWNAISQVVIEAGVYTIEWFQSIGNAVAGAIGGMFDWLIHYVNDFFIFTGWIFSIIKELVKAFILPISYVFNFLKSFTLQAFSSPKTPEATYTFSAEIQEVFETIPYWDILIMLIGVAILIIFGIAILKIFLRLT